MLVERSLMEQRYQAVLEVQAEVPAVDVARRFGVSRQAVHRWKNRYLSGGLEALADLSKRPKSSPWAGAGGGGVTQVAGQALRVGFAHRHTLVDIDVHESELHLYDHVGKPLAVIPRTRGKEVTRTKG